MADHTELRHETRIVWMSGGVVAVNNSGPELQIEAGLGGRFIGSRRMPSYPSLFMTLSQKGFPILGATSIVSLEETQGLRPPQFRVLTAGKGYLVCGAPTATQTPPAVATRKSPIWIASR
jgi:hypothetical protein